MLGAQDRHAVSLRVQVGLLVAAALLVAGLIVLAVLDLWGRHG